VSDLQVPKRRAPIELVAPGGERRSVTVFLSEFAPDHAGAERVSDVLGRNELFFPALDHASDRITFVSRSTVVLARVPASFEDGSDEASHEDEHAVELTLVDGTVLRGVVSYALAPGQSRLIDYLNLPAPFLRMVSGGDELLLVNKQHVARVALLSR
jgi:hypothetical protein